MARIPTEVPWLERLLEEVFVLLRVEARPGGRPLRAGVRLDETFRLVLVYRRVGEAALFFFGVVLDDSVISLAL